MRPQCCRLGSSKTTPGEPPGATTSSQSPRGRTTTTWGEAAGEWIGSGTKALGLVSTVDDAAFLAVLARRDPATGKWLGALKNDGKEPDQWRRTPGFDLTFSAPKSVSVLWGLAGEGVSLQVQEAHDIAVTAAMKFV